MPITVGVILKISITAAMLLMGAAWLDRQGLPASLDRLRRPVALRRVRALVVYLLVLLVAMGACYASLAWWGHRLGAVDARSELGVRVSPYIPFFDFYDLHVFGGQMSALHSAAFWSPALVRMPWEYPPAMVMLYAAVAKNPYPAFVFLCAAVLLMAGAGFVLARRLIRHGLRPVAAYGLVLATLLLAEPLWFELSLGNMELFVALMTALAIYAFYRERYATAACWVGAAAAVKIFPFVFFGLLLARRRYKELALGLVCVAALTVAGLWMMGPDMRLSWREVQAGLAQNRASYMLQIRVWESGLDHSAFGLVKRVYGLLWQTTRIPEWLLRGYMLVAAVAGVAAYFLRIVRMPVLNQVATLSVAAVLLPPTSHEYTLLHLLLPCALFAMLAVRSAAAGVAQPGLTAVMACFALLFASESEFLYDGYSLGGQFKCCVLVVLAVLLLRYRFVMPHDAAPVIYTEDARTTELPALEPA